MKAFLFFIVLFSFKGFCQGIITPEKYKVQDVIKLIKIKDDSSNSLNFVTFSNFPKNWVKPSDIPLLIKLLESHEKCKCYMSVFSSIIPNGESELSGYAIAFIESYRNKKSVNLGLQSCPEYNKEKIDEILKWWNP